MKVVKKKIADLHMPQKNIRRHTDKQIAEYIRSIEMFGQIKPLVVAEDGEILAGNGLYIALKQMGREECDCYVIEGLTQAERKKLMLADNRVYELGITDADMLDSIVRELGGDFDVPGWDSDLLEMLAASIEETNDAIESYGEFSESEVRAMANRKHEEHVPGQPAVPMAAAPAQSEQTTDAEQPERYVICPKCGERICL